MLVKVQPSKVNVEFKVKESGETCGIWNQTLLMHNDFQRFFIPKDKTETVHHLKLFQDNMMINAQTSIQVQGIFREEHFYQETI
jgi:hypothetical protein